MALNKEAIAGVYRKRAERYDISANAYYLIGLREHTYRRWAVDALGLVSGDTVVEIGCGTGLNFQLLQERVGPAGRIVGVDLTAEMLSRARARIDRHGWRNVQLMQSDAATFDFPRPVDGVISTFALTLVPEYDSVIRKAAAVLPKGKRLALLDFKLPEAWPFWLVRLLVLVSRPFGVTLDLGRRRPWESVARHLRMTLFRELYFGAVYICVGQSD